MKVFVWIGNEANEEEKSEAMTSGKATEQKSLLFQSESLLRQIPHTLKQPCLFITIQYQQTLIHRTIKRSTLEDSNIQYSVGSI